MLNDPAPEDEHSKFQASWFKTYDKLPIGTKEEPNPLYGFITVDPGGRKKGSDEWAFMVSYADSRFDLYFHRLIRGHFRMDKAIEILFNLVSEVGPIATGLETTGAQKYLLEAIQDEMRRRGVYFYIVPLAHAVHSKEVRILRLVPRYECGSIFHSREMGPLEDQLRRFPKGADDLGDVASMVLEVAVSPRSIKQKRKTDMTVDDMVWAQINKDRKRKPAHSMLGDNC